MKIPALFLTLILGTALQAEVPSVVSHYYVGPEDSQGREVTRESAVASMYVIRPVSTSASSGRLMQPIWDENRAAAARLRHTFRSGVETQYRNYGVLKGELTPEITDDLDTILKRESAVIAITEPDNPDKILQIISCAYDGSDGFPMERRFKRQIVPRKTPEWKLTDKRYVEAFGSFQEVWMNSLLLSLTPSYEGEAVELKTFIRGYKSHQDWVPLILRTLIGMELIRHGTRPMPARERVDIAPFLPQITKTLGDRHDDLLAVSGGDAETATKTHRMFLDLIHEAKRQRTIGIDEVYGEATGDALLRLYVEEYGFHDTGIVLKNGDDPSQWVHIVAAERAGFENNTMDKLSHRRGITLVDGLNFHYADAPIGTYQPCVVDLSQLGLGLTPALGTRGAILGHWRLP